MKISAISQISEENSNHRRNLFIQYSNSFMSMPKVENTFAKANKANKQRMGIENLEEFTIFPKEVVNVKTIITA